jgi:hypothetical protein
MTGDNDSADAIASADVRNAFLLLNSQPRLLHFGIQRLRVTPVTIDRASKVPSCELVVEIGSGAGRAFAVKKRLAATMTTGIVWASCMLID